MSIANKSFGKGHNYCTRQVIGTIFEMVTCKSVPIDPIYGSDIAAREVHILFRERTDCTIGIDQDYIRSYL